MNNINREPIGEGLIQISDLVLIVKFLENLSQMKRISQIEEDSIQPSFNRIVKFLKIHNEIIMNIEKAKISEAKVIPEKLAKKPRKKSNRKAT